MSKQNIREWLDKNGYIVQKDDDLIPDMIDQYTKDQSGWVSVDDRLPEGFGWFLVVDDYLTEKHNVTMVFFEGNSGSWLPIDDREDTDSMRVTHWQPLPVPPTQEGLV